MLNWLSDRLSAFNFQTKHLFFSHFQTECIYKKWFLIWCLIFIFSVQFLIWIWWYTEQIECIFLSEWREEEEEEEKRKKCECFDFDLNIWQTCFGFYLFKFFTFSIRLFAFCIYIWSEVWIEDFTVKIWRNWRSSPICSLSY